MIYIGWMEKYSVYIVYWL